MDMMRKSIDEVLRKYSDWLMSQPNVNGVCIEEYPNGEPYIKVFVTKLTKVAKERIPKQLEGYNVEIEEIGEIYPLDITI